MTRVPALASARKLALISAPRTPAINVCFIEPAARKRTPPDLASQASFTVLWDAYLGQDQVGLGRLQEQMKMSAHQAIRMHLPLGLAASLPSVARSFCRSSSSLKTA